MSEPHTHLASFTNISCNAPNQASKTVTPRYDVVLSFPSCVDTKHSRFYTEHFLSFSCLIICTTYNCSAKLQFALIITPHSDYQIRRIYSWVICVQMRLCYCGIVEIRPVAVVCLAHVTLPCHVDSFMCPNNTTCSALQGIKLPFKH